MSDDLPKPSFQQTGRIAVSLALADTRACLSALHSLPQGVALAEIRLDAMHSFDLPALVRASDRPLVFTCRPLRQGGLFRGSEAERLHILTSAMQAGAAYIDIECDSVHALPPSSSTRLIVSRHWHDAMPPDLFPFYDSLRQHGYAVKLAGSARRPEDVLPVLELLQRATTPVIAIAMGEPGRITRLVAPCFSSCLFTYGALGSGKGTAAGQIPIDRMLDRFHLHRVGPDTPVRLLLHDPSSPEPAVDSVVGPGTVLEIPWAVGPKEAAFLIPALRSRLHRLQVCFDPALRSALTRLNAEVGDTDLDA